MSVAYTQTPILVHPRARCALPSNINDSQLSNHNRIKPLPLSTPTLVSHLLGMHRAAEICKSFADAFELAGRVGGKEGVERQYQVVLEHDERLLSVLDFCPALQPTQEPYPEKVDPSREFDYLPWARYLWATLVPPFRIRWYRHFLGRSFSDERFSGARAVSWWPGRTPRSEADLPPPSAQICLEAARTLIRECKRPIPAMCASPCALGVAIAECR